MGGETYDLLRVLKGGRSEIEPLSLDQAITACQALKHRCEACGGSAADLVEHEGAFWCPDQRRCDWEANSAWLNADIQAGIDAELVDHRPSPARPSRPRPVTPTQEPDMGVQLQGRDLSGDWWELDPSNAERLYRLES